MDTDTVRCLVKGDDAQTRANIRRLRFWNDPEVREEMRRFEESIQYGREKVAAANEDREFNELLKRLKENYTAGYGYDNLPRF